MKTKKKLISILLTVSMMLTLFPFAAFADEAGTVTEGTNIVLPPDVTEASFEDGNTVYYNGQYYATLVEALKAAAGVEGAVLYCKPGAHVGDMTHGHVCATMTVYGNDAWVDGGENEFEVDTYKGNACAAHSDCQGLQKDLTLTINNLNNSGVWGQRTSNHTINVVMNNCKNAERVYISGTTGVNNITINGNTYTGNDQENKYNVGCAIYSNAPGTIKIEGCNFNSVPQPINLNNNSNREQTITVSNTKFHNCATSDIMNIKENVQDEHTYASNIRVLSTAEGGSSVLNVDNCTFTYDEDKEKANGDILLGDGRVNGKIYKNATLSIVNTAADVQMQKPGYYKSATGTDTDNTKLQTATVEKSAQPTTFSVVEAFAVAKGDGTYYDSLADAIAKNTSGTITLLNDVREKISINNGKTFTIDLNGKTLSPTGRLNINKGFVTVQNGTVKGDVALTTSATDAPYSSFTLAKDAILEGADYGIIVFQNQAGAANYGTTVNIDGKITGKQSTLWVLGNIHTDLTTAQHPVTVNVGSTAVMTNTTNDSTSLQMAGACDVTIEDGAQITGNTAVEVRAGKLIIQGGTIIGTGVPTGATPNGNGTSTTGAGIAVAQHTTALPVDVTVNGGTIKGYTGFYVTNPENNGNGQIVKATINGGQFISTGTNALAKDNNADAMTLLVNGGYFTSSPAAYVASGKAAVAEQNVIDGVTYYYTVGDKQVTDVDTSVNAGAPQVEVSKDVVNAGITEDKVTEAAKDSEKTLESAAVNVANDPSVIVKDEAVQALEEAGSQDTSNIEVVVKPYIDIAITSVDNGTVVAEIKAFYDLEAKDGQNTTAVLATKQPLDVKTKMTITIPLPTGFNATDSKAYVSHEKSNGRSYIYTGTVSEVGDVDKYNVVNFTNPHGFSKFVVTAQNNAKAEIDGVGYPSLQAAVDDAKDGQTITLLSALSDEDLKISVSGDSRTINFNNGTGADKTLNINGQAFPVKNGETESYTYTSSGGGTVVTTYGITVDAAEGGSVDASHKRAAKNVTVTLTVTPDEGYSVDAIIVTDKSGKDIAVTDKGNGKYTFTMPASDVTVKATFAKGDAPSGLPFTDVDANDWYYGPVEYVFNNGIMNGTGDGTTFSPNVPLNRAMIAAVLYNLEGGPAVDNDGAFTDVPSGQWYTDAVNWAASEGIVGGIGDGLYAPNANLTREQMASVLYRYAQYKGIDTSARADLTAFVDGSTVSPWASEVVQWAVAEKLINGAAGNTLQPQGIASRAQVATVLMNFCENVAK